MNLSTISTVVSLIVAVIALIISLRKAPFENQALDGKAAVDYATAVKTYSEEVTKLRGEQEKMQTEITVLRDDLAEKDRLIDEWRSGIDRLIAQLVSLGHQPVWKPCKSPPDERSSG